MMSARWVRRITAVVMMAMLPATTFAAPKEPGWITHTDAGSAVRVTMKSGESFDAIWMGRDGDRALFQALSPDDTFSVSIGAVRGVRMLRAQSSANTGANIAVGVAAGFWGGVLLLRMLLPRT